jgi:hypothetical protein
MVSINLLLREENKSEHDASIIVIECPKFQTRSFQREVWLYERTDHEQFSSKLDTVDWNALVSDLEDVDEMCNTFTETFLRVASECIPTKMVTVSISDRIIFWRGGILLYPLLDLINIFIIFQ